MAGVEPEVERPLAGYLVVDLLEAPFAGVTRLYAELGARVVRAGVNQGLHAMVADLGKEIVAAEALPGLLAQADLIVCGPGYAVERASERAVMMTVSPFGTGNSFSGWQATDPVLHALSSELSRSGLAGREPLLPPGELALQCAMAQAGYAGIAGLYAAALTGRGDRIDVSLLDAAVQALDPGFGISGSATLGRAAKHLPPGRPVKGFHYPILPCADGYVRLCVLAPRQWRNLFRWMGEPAAFAGPEYDKTAVRQQSAELLAAIAAFLADKTRAEIEREAIAFGVPVAALLTLEEALATEHVAAREAIVDAVLPDGASVRVPDGVIVVDGVRMGVAAAASADGPGLRRGDGTGDPARPLAGLKVLDLGVIVVGGEQSRLLADLGADVIKVESAAFPDGTRHSYLPSGLSVGFAAGHRNKRSLGLNLRHPEGKALFRRLAAEADVILSNFKPGTMESLGFGHDALAAINPGVVTVESSAFGSTGPWAGRMGYGPLVRAASGLTLKWRYPDDPESYSDSITIYPDHVGARYGTIAALALLLRRLRTGRGGQASVSQMEVMLAHFAAEIAGEAAERDAPWGVYQATGEDQWCVVSVCGDADWRALAAAIGREDWLNDVALSTREGRIAARATIDAGVAAWMRGQDADAAMRLLQGVGVPAARMLRIAELPKFDYYRERGLFRTDRHPHIAEPVTAERFHARSRDLAEPPARPAPLMGEHSAEVMRDWLGLDEGEIARLIVDGVLEPVRPEIARMLAAGEGRGEASPG